MIYYISIIFMSQFQCRPMSQSQFRSMSWSWSFALAPSQVPLPFLSHVLVSSYTCQQINPLNILI